LTTRLLLSLAISLRATDHLRLHESLNVLLRRRALVLYNSLARLHWLHDELLLDRRLHVDHSTTHGGNLIADAASFSDELLSNLRLVELIALAPSESRFRELKLLRFNCIPSRHSKSLHP